MEFFEMRVFLWQNEQLKIFVKKTINLQVFGDNC